MRKSSMFAPLLWVPVLLAALVTPSAFACGPSYSDAQMSDNLREMAQKVDMLWAGTDAEREWIAQDAWPHFQLFDSQEASESPEHVEALVASLRLWLRVEPDDWFITRVLEGLRTIENPSLEPLFADGLEHESINVRGVAVRFFVSVVRPQTTERLESIWLQETMPGIRINAMLALACQGSDRFGREFLEGIDSPHPAWAAASIHAVGQLHLEGVLPRLIQAAKSSDPARRSAAANRLAGWPDSERARATLITLLSDDEVVPRQTAQTSLRQFADSAEITTALRAQTLRDENWSARSMAFTELIRRTNTTAQELLAELQDDEGFNPEFENSYLDLSEYDSQPDPTLSSGRTYCSLEASEGDPTVAPFVRVVARKEFKSERCFQRPGVAMDPIFANRVATETPGFAYQTFVHDGQSWWLTYSDGVCWFPQDALEFLDVRPENPVDSAPALEYDLRAADTADPQLLALLEQGRIELFDKTANTVGVRLQIDLADKESVAPIVAAWRTSETLLGPLLTDAVDLLKEQHPDHPVWGEIEGVHDQHEERLMQLWSTSDLATLNER